uniref:Uncharacterized protein n=1 Tax=Alexandrium catenella TaxID=2925 RepID=A0A7S1RVU4_ALECA
MANLDAVRAELQRFLPSRGWELKLWRPASWKEAHGGREITFRDQVDMFHDVALSIQVHGAENVNMVWMPANATHVTVVKCGDTGQLTGMKTHAMGFRHKRTYPANCTVPMPKGFKVNYTINEESVYYMDVERDLLPVLSDAMAELERDGVCRAREL